MAKQDISKLDKNMSAQTVEDGLIWYDARSFTIEGRGWQETEHPYDRLPPHAEGKVTPNVWTFSQHSAGVLVRFVTDATKVAARWTLRFESCMTEQMPSTTIAGLDCYARAGESWHWAGLGLFDEYPTNQRIIVDNMNGREHEFMLYLPLYNGIEEMLIGIPEDATIEAAPVRDGKPICVYGTSIVHGGCCLRPGMAYPAIIGRHLDRPMLNLGFSGSALMEAEVAELLAELDVAAYLLDPLPNMQAELVRERYVPFVRILRHARPDTPILLVEQHRYENAWLNIQQEARYQSVNVALREVYSALRGGGVDNLHYVSLEDALGNDGEATTDGTHMTDLGFLRLADAIEPHLHAVLSE